MAPGIRTGRLSVVPHVLLAIVLALAASACSDPSDDPVEAGSDSPSPAGVSATPQGDPVEVGLFLMVSAPVIDDLAEGFEAGLRELSGLGDDLVVRVENAQGDDSLIQSIARQFAEADPDLIAVAGTPAVLATHEVESEVPIIAIAMGDPVGAGVAESLDAPGGNVTGSIDYVHPGDLLERITAMLPELTTLGTVYDPANQNMQTWIADLQDAVADAGLTLEEATVTGPGDVPPAARAVVDRSDAVLIGPDAAVIAGLPAVTEPARSNDVPVFTVGGEIVPGVLATLGPDYVELGELAAEAAAAVLDGTEPGAVPFGRPGELAIVINEQAVTELGVTIPSDIASAATMTAPESS